MSTFDARREAHGWFWRPCIGEPHGKHCDELTMLLTRAFEAGRAAPPREPVVERGALERVEKMLRERAAVSAGVAKAVREADANLVGSWLRGWENVTPTSERPFAEPPQPSGGDPNRCRHGVWLGDDCIQCQATPVSTPAEAPGVAGEGMTFEAFGRANRERCEATSGYHTGVLEYGAATWALCLAEEAGEVMGAVLGATGQKKRKAHLTAKDVGDELADLVAYADLLAHALGIDLGAAVVAKWNKVSERIGYPGRLADYRARSTREPK